jgi:hypothetical protein
MRKELNEIKEIINHYHEPFVVIYGTSVFSLAGIVCLLFTK